MGMIKLKSFVVLLLMEKELEELEDQVVLQEITKNLDLKMT